MCVCGPMLIGCVMEMAIRKVECEEENYQKGHSGENGNDVQVSLIGGVGEEMEGGRGRGRGWRRPRIFICQRPPSLMIVFPSGAAITAATETETNMFIKRKVSLWSGLFST